MRYRKFMIIMVLMVVSSGIISLISPFLLNKWMTSEIGINKEKIIILLIILLISLAVESILVFFRERFAKEFNIHNAKGMFLDFFNINYDEIQDKGPTNFIERISISVNSYYQYYTGDYIKMFSSIFVLLVVLIMVVRQNVGISLCLLALIPINYFGYKTLNKKLLEKSKAMQEHTSNGWQEIISVTNQTDYLKQCSNYNYLLNQFKPSFEKIYGTMADVNIYAQLSSNFLISVNQIVQTMIIVLVVYDFITKSTDPLSLVLYSVLLPLFFSNLNIIVNANLNKRDMFNSRNFIQGMKDNAESNGIKKLNIIDSVEFNVKNLTIKDRILSRNINGKFKKGKIIWVRGDSGSGKSTLVKLLPKFRTIDKVFINGIDIREYDNESLRQRVSYLSQNVPIIKGTLRDNLFFNKSYSKEIEGFLLKDNLLNSILQDKSMDTMINENGSNLSGGEKQKIALARALYDDVDVLILDEVTSNIDKESEKTIYKRIVKDNSEKIIFIISHDDFPNEICTDEIVLS